MSTIAVVDDKRRIRIPEAEPGQELMIQQTPDGWSVSHVKAIVPPKPELKRKWKKDELVRAIETSPIRFELGWDELKKELR